MTVYGEQRGAAVADFDGDGRVDLVVSQNGTETKLYRNVNARPGIRLGETVPAGSRVRVKYSDGSYGPVREIQTGSGYWSQNGVSPLGSKPRSNATGLLWITSNKDASQGEDSLVVRIEKNH